MARHLSTLLLVYIAVVMAALLISLSLSVSLSSFIHFILFNSASFPEDLPEGSGYERSEALFVFGVDNMNTNEVMKVFQSYNPNHLEWVNDQSCKFVCTGYYYYYQ